MLRRRHCARPHRKIKEPVLRRAPCNRQLPILPARHQASTFGLWMLNYCVRYGNRWIHPGIITGYLIERHVLSKLYRRNFLTLWMFDCAPRIELSDSHTLARRFAPSTVALCLKKISPRPISSSPLHASRHFHSCPIYLVFFKGSY